MGFFAHHRINWGEFFSVEEDLYNYFLPALFWGVMDKVTAWGFTRVPAKEEEMAIPNPNISSSGN